MKTSRIRDLLAACGLALAGAAAGASPVLHVNNGILEGASGVIVDGVSYDVQLRDGSCVSLYNGCTDTSQFAFHTSADAISALTALSAQVWAGIWGAGNVNGCLGTAVCGTYVAYGLSPDGFAADQMILFHYVNPASPDLTAPSSPGITYDTTGNDRFTNSIWTLSDLGAGSNDVPEPASFALAALALGIAGLTGRGRRRQPNGISPSTPAQSGV